MRRTLPHRRTAKHIARSRARAQIPSPGFQPPARTYIRHRHQYLPADARTSGRSPRGVCGLGLRSRSRPCSKSLELHGPSTTSPAGSRPGRIWLETKCVGPHGERSVRDAGYVLRRRIGPADVLSGETIARAPKLHLSLRPPAGNFRIARMTMSIAW